MKSATLGLIFGERTAPNLDALLRPGIPEQGWLEGVMEDITSRVEAEERPLPWLPRYPHRAYSRYMEEEIDRLANEPKVALLW